VAADEGRVEFGGGKGGEQQLIRVPPLQLQCDLYGVYWTSWNVLLDVV
jgi:hypothetical protein